MSHHDDIAILCSGKSVQWFLRHRPAHQMVLGVNRTIEVHPCDWWVFNDYEAFVWYRPRIAENGKRPRIFTSEQCQRRVTMGHGGLRENANDYEWLWHDEINTSCPSHPGWKNFSLTIAMVLAEHLGAKTITIYGCDWEGTKDWDGTTPHRAGVGRHSYRWNNEKHKFGHIVGWLSGQGVRVTRVGVDGGPIKENCVGKNTERKRSDTHENPHPESAGGKESPDV